ncbi:DUF1307 domain-containing protein, partial [Citrobacter portucalensis]|nr:DUF1307 domain-containing protein [Citrobacter portucalensis]
MSKLAASPINGSDITVSYTYKGDKVLKQISE